VKVVLSDNSTYGTIRTHQEREYPHRVSGTELANPDFKSWGRSFGIGVVAIANGDDVRTKVAEALDQDGSTLVHVKTSREALSAYSTITALRAGR
jgi:acetolactate synthase-1/2/3 large subunit